MYTLDSNAIIYFLAGETGVVKLVTKILSEGHSLYVPTIVRMEIISKPDLSLEEYTNISEFLRRVRSTDFDKSVADIAADLRRVYKLGTPDCIIAASALYEHSILITRNARDFRKVKELKLEVI